MVFGGFFAERRLRDRLEDIETRARDRLAHAADGDAAARREGGTAADARQAAVALVSQRQHDPPEARWPRALNLTLGDYAFISIAIAVAVAFLLYLVLDLAPGVALGGSLLIGIGLPNVWIGWQGQEARPRSSISCSPRRST